MLPYPVFTSFIILNFNLFDLKFEKNIDQSLQSHRSNVSNFITGIKVDDSNERRKEKEEQDEIKKKNIEIIPQKKLMGNWLQN